LIPSICFPDKPSLHPHLLCRRIIPDTKDGFQEAFTVKSAAQAALNMSESADTTAEKPAEPKAQASMPEQGRHNLAMGAVQDSTSESEDVKALKDKLEGEGGRESDASKLPSNETSLHAHEADPSGTSTIQPLAPNKDPSGAAPSGCTRPEVTEPHRTLKMENQCPADAATREISIDARESNSRQQEQPAAAARPSAADAFEEALGEALKRAAGRTAANHADMTRSTEPEVLDLGHGKVSEADGLPHVPYKAGIGLAIFPHSIQTQPIEPLKEYETGIGSTRKIFRAAFNEAMEGGDP
jgi:hypothetical protein